MGRHHFILGGARSGKTHRALQLAQSTDRDRVYIATAQALDSEMADRIAHHKTERGEGWSTIEAPLDLVSAIGQAPLKGNICLIDCLTLWLSNLMHYEHDIETETTQLCQAISRSPIPLIIVSNEVGMGLVPNTRLGRAFRDEQGRLNQTIAKVCDHVEFIVAGLPLTLKGSDN